MPGKDGTGPMGHGIGQNFGCRRGIGRNYAANPAVARTDKELLTEQKEFLSKKIDAVNKRLENL